jgi:hypothetical protein
MTAAGFRRLALSLPDTAEGKHFHVPDFRVAGKIFATLAFEKEGYGMVKLTPEQQAGMVADAPEIFSPVPGGWGKGGATRVHLKNVSKEILEGALHVAWRNSAPKKLLK